MSRSFLSSGVIAAVLCLAAMPTPAFSATGMQMLPPVKQGAGGDCTGSNLMVLAWKHGDSMRCIDAVSVDASGNLVLTQNLTSTGGMALGGSASIAGNLGLGTATPTEKLDVAGNARVTGSINAGTITTGAVSVSSVTVSGAMATAATVNAANKVIPVLSCPNNSPVLVSNGSLVCGTSPSPTPTPTGTPCAATTKNWTVGSYTCSSNVTAMANSETQSVASTNGYQGNISLTCNNGTLVENGSPAKTCEPQGSCAPQVVTWKHQWQDNGGSCSGNYPGGTTGSTKNVSATNSPMVGTGASTCNNGSLTTTTSTCYNSSTDCTPYTYNWQKDGHNCSAYINALKAGTNTAFRDTTNNGKVFAVCESNKTWTMNIDSCNGPTPTPTPTPTAPCSATGVNWSYNGVACSGPFPATAHGVTVRVNANPGFTGWADYTCINGFRQVGNKYCQ